MSLSYHIINGDLETNSVTTQAFKAFAVLQLLLTVAVIL